MLQLTDRDTLDTLISSDRKAGVIYFGTMLAHTTIDRECKGVNISYMRNSNRPPDNIFWDSKCQKTGELQRFLKHIDLVCRVKRYDLIRIEGVVNDFLPASLERYGYIEEVVSLAPCAPNNYVYYL